MIDTHTHIYLAEFDADRQEMIQRAKDAGIKKTFLPNIDSGSIKFILQLCSAEKDFSYPMMGLHPCSVKSDFEKELEITEKYLQDEKHTFYGIGECGLDYYWDKSFTEQQQITFETQILWAKKFKLPLSIHSREATDDCIALIEKHKDESLQGVFHCFSGNETQLQKIIDLDFYAGIGGVITFKNGGLGKILRAEHLPNLVLETDAPYLAPVPFRGKRNEPSYLLYILKRLSEIIGVNEEEVKRSTTENSEKVFRV
ncbi:MAG: TatD family hydrolase [Chitinophagales bacterium]